MKNGMLTRTECTALRGLAIMGIFLHNYCHWLPHIVRENEYQYVQHHVDWLEYVLKHPNEYLLVHLLSFFGHYGVPVFLFLSAYGLVLKYEGREPEVKPKDTAEKSEDTAAQDGCDTGKHSYWDGCFVFLREHFWKLFQMMFVGFVAFTMVDAITPDSHRYEFLDIVAQLGMFNNVLPHPDKIIWPGPYWFFGLMMQLYLVYRLLLYRKHWGWVVALIVVCEIIQLTCDPAGEALNRWRYNCIGGMLPFGTGLLTARYGRNIDRKLCLLMVIPSLYLIYMFSHGFFYWTLAPMAVVFTSICIVKALPQRALQPLVWMGGISAALFVCHPITRKIFIPVSRHGDVYAGLLLYIISSIALAWLFGEIIRKMKKR